MQLILLDVFASIALISATMVIVSKNPINSVIFLILVFCNATALLLLLKIEFLAMMFLIIYVGAIAVLFLFVVMMLNLKMTDENENWLRYLPIGGVISLIFFLEMFLAIDNDLGLWVSPLTQCGLESSNATLSQPLMDQVKEWNQLYEESLYNEPQRRWSSLIDATTGIQSLGFLTYTYYFYYFLMAGLILLVAMIGAIVLTMHKRRHGAKKQLIFKQVSQTFENSIGYADNVRQSRTS